jgi:hypothetical protein
VKLDLETESASEGACVLVVCSTKLFESTLELKWRHISPESYCELCGDPEETVFHVIFYCPVAKRFWAEVKKFPGISVPMLHHPSTWAMDVLDTNICSANTASLVVCGAWLLWSFFFS